MIPTEPHAPDVHPDLDTLADLQEGLLPPTPAATVSEHLEACAQCRADFAALRQLPARLAAAGDVGAIPDEVISRLEDTLVGERRAATVTVIPQQSRADRTPRSNRVLQAAAGLVLVLAATAVGVSALQDRGGDDAQQADSAGTAEKARELSDASVPILSTGANYTPESVAAAVPSLLAQDGSRVLLGTEAPQAADSSSDDRANRLSAAAPLSVCVSALADDPDTPDVEMPTPVVVDIASFDDQPATVIVLPTPADMEHLDVYVVGPQCSSADAKVLHFARVNRP
jgi:anti-sigma factor RsiW